ncbi:MAG: FHA domain-containing protein [Chloroflexota bacterium]
MRVYLNVRIDVSSVAAVPVQNAQVKSRLSANSLIQEILNQFGDETETMPETYRLYREGQEKPLIGKQTLTLQGVRSGQTLVITPFSEAQRKGVGGRRSAYLLLQGSAQDKFPIQWEPAIIGRPDIKDRVHSDLLAVNLEGYEGGARVSRRHAQIKLRKRGYILQALSEQNPTSLNGDVLEPNRSVGLTHGDIIRLEQSQIELIFMLDS